MEIVFPCMDRGVKNGPFPWLNLLLPSGECFVPSSLDQHLPNSVQRNSMP